MSKSALIELVKRDALRFGDFTLASGAKSSYYLDCRKVTLQSRGAALIGSLILEHLGDPLPDAVGGMAIGADPITGAVITAAGLRDIGLKGFIVRKESKQHGTRQMVEGPVVEGEKVVIVEDVVTTGGSSVKAIEHCRDFGLDVIEVIGIVDRLQGGADAFAAAGCPFHPLLTIRELGVEE